MDFDRSRVSALQENEGLRVARWTGQVQAGYVMVRNARRAFGLPVEARGRRFLAAPQCGGVGALGVAVAKATPPLAVVKPASRRA